MPIRYQAGSGTAVTQALTFRHGGFVSSSAPTKAVLSLPGTLAERASRASHLLSSHPVGTLRLLLQHCRIPIQQRKDQPKLTGVEHSSVRQERTERRASLRWADKRRQRACINSGAGVHGQTGPLQRWSRHSPGGGRWPARRPRAWGVHLLSTIRGEKDHKHNVSPTSPSALSDATSKPRGFSRDPTLPKPGLGRLGNHAKRVQALFTYLRT